MQSFMATRATTDDERLDKSRGPLAAFGGVWRKKLPAERREPDRFVAVVDRIGARVRVLALNQTRHLI
jgi:hypothetical protein